MKLIFTITKNEAFYMRENGYAEFVMKNYSKAKTYYLVEEPRIIQQLEKYRKSITKESYR